MKTLLTCFAVVGAVGFAHAHPLVIEESSIIAPPPGVDALWGDVALDGNEAVALSFYSYPDEGGYDYNTITSAWLFRRNGTAWTFVRKLAEGTDNSADDATNRDPIAMKNGVLALAFEPMLIFERESGNWVQKLIGPPPGAPAVGHEPASDVEIDGGRIFLGDWSWGGSIFEKDPATGNWRARASLPGDYSGDGLVDAVDYVLWRQTLNQTGSGLLADGNADGRVDASDYAVWRSRFGRSLFGSGTSLARNSVPEPSSAAFVLLLLWPLARRARA